jgi:hypothetical protein
MGAGCMPALHAGISLSTGARLAVKLLARLAHVGSIGGCSARLGSFDPFDPLVASCGPCVDPLLCTPCGEMEATTPCLLIPQPSSAAVQQLVQQLMPACVLPLQMTTAAVWQIDAVLITKTASPPPKSPARPPAPKMLSTLLFGSSSFAVALRASAQVFSVVSASTFRGTLLVPTDAVSCCRRCCCCCCCANSACICTSTV